MITFGITNNKTKQCLMPPNGIYRKTHTTSVIFLPKMFKLNLVIRKQVDKSKLRNIMANNCLGSSKFQMPLQTKKKKGIALELKGTLQLNSMCDP